MKKSWIVMVLFICLIKTLKVVFLLHTVNLIDGRSLILKFTRPKDMVLRKHSLTRYLLILQRMESTFLFSNSVKSHTVFLEQRFSTFRLVKLKSSRISTSYPRLVLEQYHMTCLLRLKLLMAKFLHKTVMFLLVYRTVV